MNQVNQANQVIQVNEVKQVLVQEVLMGAFTEVSLAGQ